MNNQKTIEQKVVKFIREKNLISSKDKILVALSGGPDSVFLLVFLNKYRKRFDIELGAFHLNHNLRGKESDEDNKFCKEVTLKDKIPFFQTSKNVKLYAKKGGLSLEEAGREIRYREMKKIAEQNGYTKIATGHTLDDNAETMLLNFIKGSGVNGLSGIVEKRDMIIRPILTLTKNEILDYLHKNKMNYRIDSSNLKNDYQRNYLRNEIIPMIRKQLNPQLDITVFKTSEIMKNVNVFINEEIDKNLKKSASFKDRTLAVNCEKLNELNEHLIGSFFHTAIKKYFNLELEQRNIVDLQRLLDKQTGRKLNLGKELTAVKERNSIIIFNKKLKDFTDKEIKLKIGDKRKIGDNVISISEVNDLRIKYSDSPDKEYVDAGKIKGSLLLRKWKEGERFHPLGMKQSKKVSDFLNEQKIPSHVKKSQLVLTESGSIVWIVGIRIDERYRINKNTARVLELCLS